MATTTMEKGRDSGKSATPTTSAHDTALTLRPVKELLTAYAGDFRELAILRFQIGEIQGRGQRGKYAMLNAAHPNRPGRSTFVYSHIARPGPLRHTYAVAKTNATWFDSQIQIGGRTATRRFFIVHTPLRAFFGRAIAGRLRPAGFRFDRSVNPAFCPPTSFDSGERAFHSNRSPAMADHSPRTSAPHTPASSIALSFRDMADCIHLGVDTLDQLGALFQVLQECTHAPSHTASHDLVRVRKLADLGQYVAEHMRDLVADGFDRFERDAMPVVVANLGGGE